MQTMTPNVIAYQPDENFFPSVSQRVNVHRDYELRYWSEKFGVTRDAVEAAAKKVGTRAEDVAHELRWQGLFRLHVPRRTLMCVGRALSFLSSFCGRL
jgi:Protein of unknown function (DUF3606)